MTEIEIKTKNKKGLDLSKACEFCLFGVSCSYITVRVFNIGIIFSGKVQILKTRSVYRLYFEILLYFGFVRFCLTPTLNNLIFILLC